MIDYCLFMILLKEKIESIKFLGEDFLLHSKINNVIQTKQIKTQDNACLTFIHKESPQFIDYFWRNILTNQTKWLIIAPRNLYEAIIIFKEIRSFGDSILIQSDEPLIIIKNLKENFTNYFRQEILFPIEHQNINTFLNYHEDKQNRDLCHVIYGNKENQILESLLSNSIYIYFGEEVADCVLNKSLVLMNMKFYIIEIIKQSENKRIGFFVHRDYLHSTWIYSLSGLKTLENVFKFNEIKLSIPV